MRVLHLWDNYAPGLFDCSLEICQAEGIDARLACMNFIARGSAKPPHVVTVRDRRLEDLGTSSWQRIRRKLRAVTDRRAFRTLVRKEVIDFQPDVIHVHYGTTGALLAADPNLLSKPFVVSFYGFDISQGLRDTKTRNAYCRLFARMPLAHVLCDEARDRVIALGLDASRVVDANLPLPVDRYPDVGIDPSGPFRWLIPARFVEKKGHAVALAAFKSHLARHPDDRMTCWGYGDSAWLEKLVSEFRLKDVVEVVNNACEGAFDEAYLRRLGDHDAILAPSVTSARGDDEGGPALTAVLAQVVGKPVIVSDFPGHERSVEDGVEGLVVSQGDPDALAHAMTELAADRDRAAAMGHAGRKRALRSFSEASYRDALLTWYRTLAA